MYYEQHIKQVHRFFRVDVIRNLWYLVLGQMLLDDRGFKHTLAQNSDQARYELLFDVENRISTLQWCVFRPMQLIFHVQKLLDCPNTLSVFTLSQFDFIKRSFVLSLFCANKFMLMYLSGHDYVSRGCFLWTCVRSSSLLTGGWDPVCDIFETSWAHRLQHITLIIHNTSMITTIQLHISTHNACNIWNLLLLQRWLNLHYTVIFFNNLNSAHLTRWLLLKWILLTDPRHLLYTRLLLQYSLRPLSHTTLLLLLHRNTRSLSQCLIFVTVTIIDRWLHLQMRDRIIPCQNLLQF